MRLIPQGDYYLWHCEWCDSRNLTLWTKVVQNDLCCTACHKHFTAFDEGLPESPLSATGCLVCP